MLGMDIAQSLRQIERCRYPSGLYAAVPADSQARLEIYANMWLRDTIYTLLAYDAVGDVESLREGIPSCSTASCIAGSPASTGGSCTACPETQVEYLHPRYAPDGSEIHHELWGLRQDDAVGLVIWALSRWHERFGVLRNARGLPPDPETDLVPRPDRRPQPPDNGIWEEEEPTQAVHLSSLGAVAAGLNQASRIGSQTYHPVERPRAGDRAAGRTGIGPPRH